MKVLKLDEFLDLNDLLSELINYVKEGKVVLMPSDTCYGFLGDSGNLEVRKKISKLKQMPDEKKISLCAGSKAMFVDCLDVDQVSAELIEEYLPGALTIVGLGNTDCKLDLNSEVLEHELILNGEFVGVRLPEHNLMTGIAEGIGRPVFTTSANVHTKPTCYSLYELEKQMGDSFLDIDVIVDGGVLNFIPPSTIVKIDDNVIEIIRSGLIADELVGRYKIQS